MIAAVITSNPHYFAPNHTERTIEVFENLDAVIKTHLERVDAGGRTPIRIRYLNGDRDAQTCPLWNEGTAFECFEIGSSDFTQHPALRHLNEALVEDVLTRVHTKSPDWVAVLQRDDRNDMLGVQVTRG